MDQEYLESLVLHEVGTYFKKYCSDPRRAMILLWWVALNNMGDLLWNDLAQYEKREILVSDIILWGTNPKINKIILEKAEKDPMKLKNIANTSLEIYNTLDDFASYGNESILLVDIWWEKYKIFDGMHRVVGHILKNKRTISAYVLTNYWEFKPNIEAHVLYDLIKAFQRSSRSIQDKKDLIWALRLLVKNTENATKILEQRFDISHLNDPEIQENIQEALKYTHEKNI